MNEVDNHERRRSPRQPLRAYARAGSGSQHQAHVLDLSHTGARIAILDEHEFQAGDKLTLTIEPDNVSATLAPYLPLHLEASVVHRRQHILGLQCAAPSDEDERRLQSLLQGAS